MKIKNKLLLVATLLAITFSEKNSYTLAKKHLIGDDTDNNYFVEFNLEEDFTIYRHDKETDTANFLTSYSTE